MSGYNDPDPVEKSAERIADKLPTLRDQFAMAALTGMLAYPGDQQRGSYHNNATADGVAILAFRYADAMLRARVPEVAIVPSESSQEWWLDGGQFYCPAHRSGIPVWSAPANAVCAECSKDAPESWMYHARPATDGPPA